MRRLRLVGVALGIVLMHPATTAGQHASTDIRIGILSHRGDVITERTWTPTADYLSAALPGYRFHVQPLDFAEIDAAVGGGSVDFVLANPSIYVNLEVRHRVSRIATLRNRVGERFSVLVTEAEDDDARVQFRSPAVLARARGTGLVAGEEAQVRLVAVDPDEGRIDLEVVA